MPPAAGERTQLHVRHYLPEEIQKQILSRLTNPATIVRFRCVSKSWRRLLSEDHELIAMILFSDDDIKGKEAHVFTTAAPGLTPYSVHSYDALRPVSSGKLPESDAWRVVRIAGCSNGIFCITDTYYTGKIGLWNPTTSETKVLPPPPSSLPARPTEVGFGFDPVTEDYKVLILLWDFTSPHLIYLYSLRKNSWKHLPDSWPSSSAADFFTTGQSVGLVASRAPKYSKRHWINVSSNHGHFILITFDMSKEAFTQLNLPTLPINRPEKATFHIVKDGPCLAAVCSGIRPESTPVSSFLKVWAALDYEALAREECSWMMMYDVDCREPIAAALPPLGQSASGNWVYGKFFVEWTMATYSRVYAETVNGVVDHKVKNGEYLLRVAYLPSTMSMAAPFRGRRSVIHRAIDRCASIFRRVFLKRLCED